MGILSSFFGGGVVGSIELLDSLWAKQVGQRAITVTDIIRTGEY